MLFACPILGGLSLSDEISWEASSLGDGAQLNLDHTNVLSSAAQTAHPITASLSGKRPRPEGKRL